MSPQINRLVLVFWEKGRTEGKPWEKEKCSSSLHFRPPQGESISISAGGEDVSVWLADAAGPRWSVRTGIAMRHRDMARSHFPKAQPPSPCWMSSKWRLTDSTRTHTHTECWKVMKYTWAELIDTECNFLYVWVAFKLLQIFPGMFKL